MKIHQLRNATIIVEIGFNRILIDPMLSPKNALPPLRVFGARQRNPLVELPGSAATALESVTHCLITHCQKGHFDHLDRVAKKWLRDRQIPVISTPHDACHLSQRGLNVQPLPERHEQPSPFLGGQIRTVRCTHGRGLIGRLMEHGVGYLIEAPGEPSLYLSGDTVLTPLVREFVAHHRPQVCVVPAGGARFDMGGDIIMGIDEVIEFTRLAPGTVVANHLEALSHCPVTRSALALAAREAGVESRLHVPIDGEELRLPVSDNEQKQCSLPECAI
ncbi:MBL fold metallo-hydrolase [Paraburkholderia nemoris]|uniref:MBL fold metallo-hydrolase n=1 Tax=Paraburkholderia nemoris TaxID=2793076 RepID=UPI0038B7E1BD